MFAGIARRYDFLNHFLSCHIDKLWRRAAVRAAAPVPGTAVLDVCAGTGDLTLAFARRGARAVGADFCPEMIALAGKKKQPAAGKARFLVADTQHLPHGDASFDAVSVAFGIRNVEDWERGLSEMARVTRPGGKVLILEFAKPRSWLFRKLYYFYFLRLLPTIGRWVSGDSEAYRYLPESVMQFASPEELKAGMERAGLGEVSLRRLTGGIAVLLVGRKPPGRIPAG